MSKPVEILLFEFLQESVDAAVPEPVLYGIDVQDTVWRSITNEKPNGVRISDAVSTMRPDVGGGLKEFDAELQLVCFAKVDGADLKERSSAMQRVYEIQQAITGLLLQDPELGDRVCDVDVERASRGFDTFDGKPYAVAMIPLTINPTGYES